MSLQQRTQVRARARWRRSLRRARKRFQWDDRGPIWNQPPFRWEEPIAPYRVNVRHHVVLP